MAELTDELTQLLDGRADEIGRQIGADGGQTRSAIHSAIPALLSALSANAGQGSGMRQALARDHDGSILDDIGGYLGGSAQLSPRTTNGAGILEHTLGDRQPEVQQALSAKSGLDMGSVGSLLALLAPIVMGMLGKRGGASGGSGGSGGGLGGSGGSAGFGLDDIGDLLNREKADARGKDSDIGDILDQFERPKG
ncbi:MAG: DUF937 domain-containing protein [Chloroflexota bacterium]|nr:DUF937 domain-containing protein [Chloroflexota bacterium]